MTTNEFGPNTPKVRLFIERLKVMSVEEVKGIAVWRASRDPRAWNPARNPALEAAWDTARSAAWVAARDAALEAAWDTARSAAWVAARDAALDAAWDTAWVAAWVAARDAALDAPWDTARRAAWDAALDAAAIVVMDLITEEQFTTLTEPFAEILTELGIVWEGK